MKNVLCLLCLLFVAACGDKKPGNPLQGAEQNAPPPVAVQEREIQQRLEAQKKELDEQQRQSASRADRLKYAEPLLDMTARWGGLRASIAYPNPNMNTRELLERMEAAKKEAEAAEADSCASPGKASLIETMGLVISIVSRLGENNNKVDAAIQKDIDRANELQNQAESQLRSCAA
jgi:hypothetical protein